MHNLKVFDTCGPIALKMTPVYPPRQCTWIKEDAPAPDYQLQISYRETDGTCTGAPCPTHEAATGFSVSAILLRLRTSLSSLQAPPFSYLFKIAHGPVSLVVKDL